MPDLIFRVADTFTIEGRGIVATPAEWGTGSAHVGDAIVLRRPDGSEILARVRDITYPQREILLPSSVTKSDVSAGTEIWTADD